MSKFNVKGLFFSNFLLRASFTQKIAYIGVLSALSVVVNAYISFPVGDTQFSVTIFFSMLMGILLGSVPGFAVCVLGDLIGCVIQGFAPLPFIGIATGMTAFIAGIIVNGIITKTNGGLLVKLVISCVLVFLICTIGINTTGWYFYGSSHETMGYFSYVILRIFVKLQFLNCLANYIVICVFVPLVLRNKFFQNNAVGDNNAAEISDESEDNNKDGEDDNR